jgi:hypothetical protein
MHGFSLKSRFRNQTQATTFLSTTTNHQAPIANHQLPTTNHQTPTINRQLPTAATLHLKS